MLNILLEGRFESVKSFAINWMCVGSKALGKLEASVNFSAESFHPESLCRFKMCFKRNSEFIILFCYFFSTEFLSPSNFEYLYFLHNVNTQIVNSSEARSECV